MKSTRFVSPNFPERVAEPESPFHPDYLAHRRNLIRLAATVNEELSTTVETLNREFVHQTEEIHLRYSNALATAGLSRAELASNRCIARVRGRTQYLADAAFSDLKTSLEFLGI
jgi:hypothetical protein